MTTPTSRYWLAVTPAMLVPFVLSLLYFDILPDHPVARVLYTGSKVFLLVWPVFSTVVIYRERIPWPDVKAQKHWRAIPLGLIVGGVIVGAMFVLMETSVGDVVRGGAGKIRERAIQFGFLEHYWLFAIFIALGNSLFEEYYWRWFVFGGLRKVVPLVPALLLAGVAFAAHHVLVLSQFFPTGWAFFFGGAVGVGGAIWCILYERQKTLMGAWVSHIVVDFGMLTIGHQILNS